MPISRRDFLAAASTAALAAAARPALATGPSAHRPMKLLVLGGTAFLGPELVEAARARGHVVTLFNRGKTRPHLFPDLEKLRGDRDGQLEALRGRSWDVVIDTSGYVPRIVRLSAELLAPSVERYLFVSSISAYADDVKAPVDEASRTAVLADPASEEVRRDYGALKAACERAAEAALPGRAMTVRPGLIVGPGDPTDRFTYWPVRLARGGEVLAPGDGTDPMQWIDVRDLAAWMILAAEARLAGTYNAVGPATRATARDLVEGCRAAVGSEARLTWVDAPFLEKQGVAAWSDLPVWFPAAEGALAQVSAAKAVAAGLAFRPLAATARDTLAWWRTLPAERTASPRAGLSPGREREVLAAWAARPR
jgi:2'-hydroxyisoflavone reductase